MEFALFISILLLLISSSSSSSSSIQRPCNKDDAKALLAMKSSFKHDIFNWNQSTDCCVDDWQGVLCNPSGRVISFLLKEEPAFVGQIPPQIGDLPYLTKLAMWGLPHLTGPIPNSISKLKQLTLLNLMGNSLSGPVPVFLSQLTKLDYLNLAHNRFTGSIPASLGSLPLTFLRLTDNKLSGPIPESLGRIPGPVMLFELSWNKLSGPIPKSFANAKFEVVYLSHNKLTGDAWFLHGQSSTLQYLDLSVNMLEFDLTNVKLPENLDVLHLSKNKIYGSIPREFMAREYFTFNVSYNMLCGEIPASEIPGQNSDPTAFFHNKYLCGPPLSPCK